MTERFIIELPISGVSADMAGMPAEWLERAVRAVGVPAAAADRDSLLLRVERAEVALDDLLSGNGFVYFDDEVGTEYAVNHPVESGEMPDATDIRRSTAIEDSLNASFQSEFSRADVAAARGRDLEAALRLEQTAHDKTKCELRDAYDAMAEEA